MAKILNSLPKNVIEYPNSFKRQGAFPLDVHSLFMSYNDAHNYAQNDPLAYVGQPIVVAFKNAQLKTIVDYYIIGDESGTLIHVANSLHTLDEINNRIEEIEKFFQLEEGETLKDTLDQLIELQNWIEEHGQNFEDFQETIQKELNDEIKRAKEAEQVLTDNLSSEITRAKKTEQALDEKIDAITLTEETVLLANHLYTYAPIGKAQTASNGVIGVGDTITQTNRGKIGNKGDTLKSVFDNIFGTREDALPTITNNASLTVNAGTTQYGGGEYGTAVKGSEVIITFTLNNTGTTNYGYTTETETKKGSQTFYYPIVKQEGADIAITLPAGKTAMVTKGTLVKTSENILYCDLDNKQVSIKIILPEDSVELTQQTRYEKISASIILGIPQDANGNTLTKFLTYLESEDEAAKLEAPTPEEKKGGTKSNNAGPYTIKAGSKYVYWAKTINTNSPTTWTRYGSGQTSVIDLQLSCNAGEYLWVASPNSYGSLYAWNDASGKYNTDKLPTTKTANNSLTNAQNAEADGYYFYRTTNAMQIATNTKFKLQ